MENLQRLKSNIDSAKTLESIVATMKAHASSNINQFENAAKASKEYRDILDKSLYILFLESDDIELLEVQVGVNLNIIFGSDYGLAGRFNERITEFSLNNIPNSKENINIVIGLQIYQRLQGFINIKNFYNTPQTVDHISNMVNQLLIRIQNLREEIPIKKIQLYYNRPLDRTNFTEEILTLFPLNLHLLSKNKLKWSSNNIPTYFIKRENLTSNLIQQYLFITLYRTFCYSLASENGNRLSSMEAAEKNIQERLVELNLKYRIQRQNSITEELNDIISGFKTIKKQGNS